MPQPIDNIDLDFLSDTERDLILEVLRRDEVLRQAEEQRIRKLKAELLEIKRKGAKRGSIRYSQRSCARCHGSLSLLAFSSNHCQCCHHLICRKCRANLPDGSWLCSVCVKESNIRKTTGDWFYNRRVNRFSTMPGHELVRSSLRKRPVMKKYATVGDVLLRNSESSRGPPVPVPRHKVSATDKRPSSENSDSVTSMASFEPKEDGIFSHGPPSEYSGSVASTVSFERKGIGDLFKPSQSDTELSELASLTSSKTGPESGRVTPDLPRRAVLPPHYNQSSVTLLPDAISIHSYSSEAEAAPEINRAIPSQEFDVDKLFKKSISHVRDPHDDGMDVGKQPDSYKVPVEVKSQFGQVLDTQNPEIKQVCPSPELDAQKLFKKSVTRTQNTLEHHSTLDLRDNRDTLTVPMGNRSQSVPDLDMQDDEEEDIDSLVNTHRNSMASSASSMSVSMTSIYSDSGDSYSVDVRGEVVFSMFYDEPTQSLQVLIKECRKLACGDSLRQFSNPYVKCYLLPDKSRQSKRKTTIKRHTCDPVYEETFKYNIRRNQLLTRSMLISVWHHGHLGSNPFLGEVEIALDCYDLDRPQEECMPLMTKAPCCIPASAFTQFKGELVISLKYVTPKGPRLQKFKGKKVVEVEGGELHILIKEAKNLMAMKGGGGTSDSFVKGYLFPSKSKTTKRKTPVVKKNLNPHYGHTFVYKELTLEQLRTMCLELTVWDREPMLSNEFLGGVRLSSGEGTVKIGNQEVEMDSVGEEVSLWKKMMQYPDSWAEGTLPLRTTMRKKKGK